MTGMEQEQASAKRSSLSVGDLLLVKQGMAGKVPLFEQMRSTVSFLGNEFLRVMKLQTGGISYGN
jgi:hypothetical protein